MAQAQAREGRVSGDSGQLVTGCSSEPPEAGNRTHALSGSWRFRPQLRGFPACFQNQARSGFTRLPAPKHWLLEEERTEVNSATWLFLKTVSAEQPRLPGVSRQFGFFSLGRGCSPRASPRDNPLRRAPRDDNGGLPSNHTFIL